MHPSFSIYMAYPRGYCAWVHRAVDMLMQVIMNYPDETIYVNHEIIHNNFVIRMFEKRWVVFESDISKIPEGSLLVISAHGSGPTYFTGLRERKIRWIDATCPLVDKVHREARELIHKGYHILYIGKKWHQEAIGVIDEGEEYFTLIEKMEDVESVSFSEGESLSERSKEILAPQGWQKKLALLTQTTLSVDDTDILIREIQKRFPDIVLPKVGDICYATTNRQKAIKVLAEKCELILVIGSPSSSNSNKLRHTWESLGKKTYLIDDASEIDPDWLLWVSSVGVTAWASGPEELVEGALQYLESLWGTFIQEIRVIEENIEFPYTLKIQS